MTRSLLLYMADIVVLVGWAGSAQADDALSLQDLLNEKVITTASQSSEDSSTAPASSSILTAEDIQRYGIHSISEAIDFLSLGLMTSNSLSMVDVGARGVLVTKDQGDHFRLLINGHAVNDPYFGSARFDRGAGVPMEFIDHIECILGPGSLLYGSNAMLGIVNIVTKNAKNYNGVHAIFESEILKSYRISGGAGYTFSLFGKPIEATLGLEYYTQKGPAFTLGPQNVGTDPYTGSQIGFSSTDPATGIWGGLADESYFTRVPTALARIVAGDFTLIAHALTYKRSAPYGSTNGQGSLENFNDPRTYELDRRLSIELKYQKVVSRLLDVRARLYGDSFDYQQHVHYANASGCSGLGVSCQTYNLAIARWLGAEVQVSLNWLPNKRLSTLVGTEVQLRSMGAEHDILDGSGGTALAPTKRTLDKMDAIVGAYVQQVWKPHPKVGLNGGIRVDYDPRFAPVLSPRLTANYSAGHGLVLKAVYTQAFRAPSWYETSYSNIYQIQSQNLDLEKEQSVEVSVDQKFRSNRIFVGIFQTFWNNLVSSYAFLPSQVNALIAQGRLPSNAVFAKVNQFQNITSINNQGFNLGLDGAVYDGRFRYGINVTGALARVASASNENSLPVAPNIFGNFRASYDFSDPAPTIALAAFFQGRRFATGLGVGSVPPQLEFRWTVSGRVPLVKGLFYRFSADYAQASRSPYLIGPGGPILNQVLNDVVDIELAPVDVFRTTVGLQYNFQQ